MNTVRCNLEDSWLVTTLVGLKFSPDGRWLVAVDDAAELSVFDTRTGQPVYCGRTAVELDEGTARSWLDSHVTFSTDGRLVALTDQLETVRVMRISQERDWSTPENLSSFSVDDGCVLSLSFSSSPDEQRLLAVFEYSGVAVWSVGQLDKGPLWQVEGRESAVFSPDGRHVFCCGPKHPTEMRDAGTGEVVRTFKTNEFVGAYELRLSPDGSCLLTLPLDNDRLLLWDTSDGRLLNVLDERDESGQTDGRSVIDFRFSRGQQGETTVMCLSGYRPSSSDPWRVVRVSCRNLAGDLLGTISHKNVVSGELLADSSVLVWAVSCQTERVDLSCASGLRSWPEGKTVSLVTADSWQRQPIICRVVKNPEEPSNRAQVSVVGSLWSVSCRQAEMAELRLAVATVLDFDICLLAMAGGDSRDEASSPPGLRLVSLLP